MRKKRLPTLGNRHDENEFGKNKENEFGKNKEESLKKAEGLKPTKGLAGIWIPGSRREKWSEKRLKKENRRGKSGEN